MRRALERNQARGRAGAKVRQNNVTVEKCTTIPIQYYNTVAFIKLRTHFVIVSYESIIVKQF